MLNGPPPPPGHPRLAAQRLEAARGGLRDTLGAIRNLEQLLKSIRVGPKALASVIPDVHESCEPLVGTIRKLLTEIEEKLPDAARAVNGFISPRVEELERALAHAITTTMHARERLTLENVVTGVRRDLDAALILVELLEESIGGAATRVDLLELVREAFKAAEYHDDERTLPVSATLTCHDNVEVLVNPRVAMRLIAISVGQVVSNDPAVAPHVAIGRTESGAGGVTISSGPQAGDQLLVEAAPRIGPMLPCALAAARATQAQLERSADGRTICIAWPLAED